MDTIKVMVVEDDFMVAEINRQVAEQVEGFSVVKIAHNGKKALQELNRGEVDLVILDVYLPDIQGIDVLKEARKREIAADFILITAAHDARIVEESMRYGIYDYIIKPFNLERYKDALQEYRLRHETLSANGFLDQGGLDKVMEKKAATHGANSLPKGIAIQTLAKVSDFVDRSLGEEVSASDLTERLSLSRVTAHRYLKYLTETGRLSKELSYRKVGRPAVFYRKIRQG